MTDAYHADSALEAEAALLALAKELDRTHPGAAASLSEGLDETLTVLRHHSNRKCQRTGLSRNGFRRRVATGIPLLAEIALTRCCPPVGASDWSAASP